MQKLRFVVKILVVSFCAALMLGCHKSNGNQPEDQPASAPDAPTISAPKDGEPNSTGKITVSWSSIRHKGGLGSTWNVVDNEDTVFNSVEINTSPDGQNASAQLSLDPIEPSHTLAVTLCNRDGCTSSTNTIKITIAPTPHQ